MKEKNKSYIYSDPIYGFIHLNQCEWEIIHSPFYQRLRWIRQLGFSSYVFHGAEHSRYGHSIGVLYNAHKILESCKLAVSDEELFDSSCLTDKALFHKSLRLGALMHDLGTFPFSHTTETSYIHFGEKKAKKNQKTDRHDDHEHLGSFIIKNTDYENGITFILKKYGFDPQTISGLVKGVDPCLLANQILHSEVDCDRMDYLLRDAHYTGLRYGSYDRDYLLHHFQVREISNQKILTINHNALHCVEDFLNSRFAWYSQVVRSSRGARYDAIAEELCTYFLEKKIVWSFEELLEMAAESPHKFYQFNDTYFMSKVYEAYTHGKMPPKMKYLAYALLYEQGPGTVRLKEFRQRLLNQDQIQENEKIFKKTYDKVSEIQQLIKKKGGEGDWIVVDIPKKHIEFVKSHGRIVRGNSQSNVLLERDPVKISYRDGEVKLLAEVENSTISRLQNVFNFVPNVYAPEQTLELLRSEGILS